MPPQEQPARGPSGRVTWEDAGQTVIRVDLSPANGIPAEPEERFDALMEAGNLAGTVPHRVDFLVDVRQSGGGAIRGNWLEFLRRINERLPDNAGLFVVAGSRAPRLFENVLRMLGRFQSMRITAVFVPTLEEARAVLDACQTERRVAQSSPSEH